MLIRKVGSNVVHQGYIPHDMYEAVGKPTRCGQSGWHAVWRIVHSMRAAYGLRKCRKCFRAEAAGGAK